MGEAVRRGGERESVRWRTGLVVLSRTWSPVWTRKTMYETRTIEVIIVALLLALLAFRSTCSGYRVVWRVEVFHESGALEEAWQRSTSSSEVKSSKHAAWRQVLCAIDAGHYGQISSIQMPENLQVGIGMATSKTPEECPLLSARCSSLFSNWCPLDS